MKMLLLLVGLLWNTENTEFHAFHISKTDMVFNPKEKTMQITMHIFIDDLERGFEKQGQKGLAIGTDKEKKEANDLIFKYLQSHFLLKVNSKDAAYQMLGKEPATDKQAIWIYLEVKNINVLKNIYVENKVLTEVFSDQKNIVQINVPSKTRLFFIR